MKGNENSSECCNIFYIFFLIFSPLFVKLRIKGEEEGKSAIGGVDLSTPSFLLPIFPSISSSLHILPKIQPCLFNTFTLSIISLPTIHKTLPNIWLLNLLWQHNAEHHVCKACCPLCQHGSVTQRFCL